MEKHDSGTQYCVLHSIMAGSILTYHCSSRAHLPTKLELFMNKIVLGLAFETRCFAATLRNLTQPLPMEYGSDNLSTSSGQRRFPALRRVAPNAIYYLDSPDAVELLYNMGSHVHAIMGGDALKARISHNRRAYAGWDRAQEEVSLQPALEKTPANNLTV